MKNQNDLDHDLQHIFDKYAKNLCLYALNYLETEADAEDIVQDVFYDFIKHRSYRQIAPEALTTYLFRCIRNTCLNRLRNRKLVMEAELLKFEAAEEEAMTISPDRCNPGNDQTIT